MSILFIVMKPFSIDYHKLNFRGTIFSLLGVVLVFICGCGGFSSSDSLDGDNSPVVFFQGQVQFPGGASGSLQKISGIDSGISNSNISKALQNVQGVTGANIGLFKSSDLFFQNNLLKTGEVIQTNSLGQFSIIDNQLISSAFRNQKEAFILRASFNNFELSSLVTVDENNSPVQDSIAVNVVSDGAIRYLREEVAQKVGGVSDNDDIGSEAWKNDFEKLILEFSDRREEIQQKFTITNFNKNDYLVSSTLSNRNAGQQWVTEIDRLAKIESDWSRIAVNKEELKLSAITSRSLPDPGADFDTLVRRRKLQLFYTFLEFGFAVSNGSGKIFVKDDWKNLEQGLAPEFKSDLDAASIRSSFDSQITNEDLNLFPIPGGIIEFSLQELSTFSLAGPSSEEKKVLIAQDLGRRPWVTLEAIDILKAQELKLFASIRDVISSCAATFLQRRFSVERVQDDQVSGGLAFFGELVEIPEAFGGSHAPSELFIDFWEQKSFNSNFASGFEALLEEEEIYLSMIRDVYLSEYAELLQRSQSITLPNNGYPDPVSVNATRNLVFRKSQNSPDFILTRTPKVARKIDLLEKAFESIHKTLEGSLDDLRVDLDTKRNLSQLIPWFTMLLNHSFPLQSQLGFYKEVLGTVVGKNPRYENLRVFRFDPAFTDQLWNDLVGKSQVGVSIATDSTLPMSSASLEAMRINTLPWLSVAKSERTSVVASGQLFLKNEYPNSPVATNFPVRATIQSTTSNQTTSFTALADSTGKYEFSDFPVKGDELYHFNFVVKNTPGSLPPTIVLSYAYYVAGFEERLDLPDFFMESQYQVRATTYDGNINNIQPENFAPEIQLDSIPDVTSGIIPLSITIIDPESQPADIEFKFTSGFDLTISTSVPKISFSSIPVSQNAGTTFPLDGFLNGIQSSASGYRTTIYWHSVNEPGPGGSLGSSSIDDMRVEFSVYESNNRVIKGNTIFSNFFDLDNESPTISFNPPLKDLRIANASDYPESVLKNITLTGSAVDSSQIHKIFVRNISLEPLDLSTYLAVNTGDNFGTWRIDSVPLEPGVENFLEFFIQDIYGNQNSQAITASVFSLDSSPPKLELKKITIPSTRNTPILTSLIVGVGSQVSNTVTSFGGVAAVELTLVSTSTSLSMGTLTTSTVKFEGVAKDVNGVSLVRVNGKDAIPATTDGINYTWSKEMTLPESGLTNVVFTAIDNKNNNSGTTNPNDAVKRLSAINLAISTVDYSSPCVNIVSPDNGDLKTRQAHCGGSEDLVYAVTSKEYELLGSADDRSRITSFVICSQNVCIPITGNYINWSASLALSEASTNLITGHIEDEFGFRETFATTSPLVTLNLNDITPPSMVVTSRDGIALSTPYIVDSSFSDLPLSGAELINVTNCNSTTCAIDFSGHLLDNSGIDLLSNSPNDFNGFKLRMCNLNEQGCNPNLPDASIDSLLGSITTLLPNGANFTNITTFSVPSFVSQTNGRQTRVPFNASVVLQDDGFWPMQVTLADDSTDQFPKYSKPTIRKSNIFVFKKDTVGPVISNISLSNSEYVSGGSFVIDLQAEDELSVVTDISVDSATLVSSQINSSVSSTSPWLEFVVLDSGTSKNFVITVTVPSGINQQINLNVTDAFGNVTSITRDFSVYPIFNNTIKLREQFTEPLGLAFGGESLDQVVIGDASQDAIQEYALNAVSINTFTGNQNLSQSYYSSMTDLIDFDYLLDIVDNDESMVVIGKFGQGQGTKNEAVRFVKDKSSPSLLNKFKIEGSTEIPGGAYHALRGNSLSIDSDSFASGSLVKFAPKLESVIYAYKPTDANLPQLIRYVNGFSSPLQDEPASAGGVADSTGIINAFSENAKLSSQVKVMVVTQVHVPDLNGPEGVLQSEEHIFLADAGLKKIVRFRYDNFPDPEVGFSALPSISLTGIDPTTGLTVSIDPIAMDIEQSGSVAYVASATDLRIYKLDISGAVATVITSFGGYGFGDGKFESITSLKGRRALGESDFSEIYAVDTVSKRISVFSTTGEFIRYFGQNFYGLGGMRKPSLIGVKNDNWFVTDDDLKSIDFYSSEDNVQSRQLTGFATGSVGIENFTSSLALIYADEVGSEDLTNFLDSGYTNSSAELFKTVTQELFYLQSPRSLQYVVQRRSSFFSAVTTNSQRLVVVDNIDDSPETSQINRGRVFFEDLIDMTLVRDDDINRVYVLENDSLGSPRVQMIPFQGQSAPNLFGSLPSTDLTSITTATGICSYTSGLVVIGQGNSQIAVANFEPGTKLFQNNWTFEFPTLLNLSGESMTLTSPSEIDCSGSEMAIFDRERVLIYEIPGNLTEGITLKQEIVSTDSTLSSTNPLSRLTSPVELQFFNDDLYLLENSRNRVLKYDLR